MAEERLYEISEAEPPAENVAEVAPVDGTAPARDASTLADIDRKLDLLLAANGIQEVLHDQAD